jgi:uncharacterized membrane protein YeaQ/YmgE (transglycosylase-associated protein family)
MFFVAWLVVGVVIGFISVLIAGKHKGNLVSDILVGMMGSILGGVLFRQLGDTDANAWSVLVAVITGVAALAIYHAIAGRGRLIL